MFGFHATVFVYLLSKTLLPLCVCGQGVNIKVPLPIVDDILGSNDDKDHEDRWWFWVIIGIIGAFFIVGIYFTARGFLRYRMLRKQQEEDETRLPQHFGLMGRRLSSDYIHNIQDPGGTVQINNDDMKRDMIRRCGVLCPGNTSGAMLPVHGSAGIDATSLREHMVMHKINPRVIVELG